MKFQFRAKDKKASVHFLAIIFENWATMDTVILLDTCTIYLKLRIHHEPWLYQLISNQIEHLLSIQLHFQNCLSFLWF